MEEKNNWLAIKCRVLQRNEQFTVINTYGPTQTREKREVWQQITQAISIHGGVKGIIAGDFNATLNHEEKKGGVGRITRVQLDFQEFVNNNHLMDITKKMAPLPRKTKGKDLQT